MPVVIPFTFVGGPGNKAKASQVNANFQSLAAMFTEGAGGIKDGDISVSCDFNSNKLSSTAGKRITAPKFEPGAVDATALKSDPVGGATAAVQTPDHIKDGVVTTAKLNHTGGSEAVDTGAIRDLAVTKGKLAAAPGTRPTYAELGITVQEVTFTQIDLAAASGTAPNSNCTYALSLEVSGANYVAKIHATAVDAATLQHNSFDRTVTPGTPIPTASNKVIPVLKDIVVTYGAFAWHINGKVVFYALPTS